MLAGLHSGVYARIPRQEDEFGGVHVSLARCCAVGMIDRTGHSRNDTQNKVNVEGKLSNVWAVLFAAYPH